MKWLGILIFLTLISCAIDGDTGNPGGSIFFKSQAAADDRLDAFDKENPSCQLWTNWQKMCSRTGPNGATFCVTDPDQPVRPSEPFCAGDEVGFGAVFRNELTAGQLQSSERFCIAFDSESRLAKRLGRPVCHESSGNRPFNGYRIAARQHPWCKVWKDKKSLKVITSKEGLAKPVNSEEGFYCAKKQVPNWCAQAGGFGLAPSSSPEFASENRNGPAVLGVADSAMAGEVAGIFCKRRIE